MRYGFTIAYFFTFIAKFTLNIFFIGKLSISDLFNEVLNTLTKNLEFPQVNASF